MANNAQPGFRLSPQQRRLWTLEQISGGCRFTVEAAIEISGPVVPSRLRSALCAVVDRHEILRTDFSLPTGLRVPLQYIKDKARVEWRESVAIDRPEDWRDLLIGRRVEERSHHVRAELVSKTKMEHVLLLGISALRADTTSIGLLVRELANAYVDEEEQTREEAIQYADLAEIFNELLESGESETGRQYWRRHTAANSSPQFHFIDEPGESLIREPGCLVSSVPVDLASRIDRLADEYQASIEAFLLACWQTLLWRLSGKADISIAVADNGRRSAETAGAIGPITRYLPHTCVLDGEHTFVELLNQTQQMLGDFAEWQEYFDPCLLQGEDQGCFLKIAFDFEKVADVHTSEEITFYVAQLNSRIEPFEIRLSAIQHADELVIQIHYDAGLVCHSEAQRLVEQLLELIRSAVNRPETRPGELDFLPESEHRGILGEIREAAAVDLPRLCVHEIFERQAARTPDSPAVAFEGRRLTYQDLNNRANQIAHMLRRLGAAPDMLIALYLDRSLDSIPALLGILKAGAAYVPLDPSSPKARLASQIEGARVRILITKAELLDELPGFDGQTLCLDKDSVTIDEQPVTDPQTCARPQHAAYVIFTSGSTGLPKGVTTTHEGLSNYACFISGILYDSQARAAEGLHFASVTTIAADLGNTAIFPSLISGGCLHLISRDTATDLERFSQYCSQNPIDVLKIVPSHLGALLSAGEGCRILPRKYLVLGGEPFPAGLFRLLSEVPRTCEIINHYGPTETTVGSIVFRTGDRTIRRGAAATVPIGRPIANTEAYVLDESMKLVPRGVPGELYLGGVGLARGYANLPDHTAERFLPNPFAGTGSSRIYRTGDLVRVLSDGSLEFLSRIDQQVKIRGFRIELGEIEAALNDFSGVNDSAVLALEEATGEKRLVAFVVSNLENAPLIRQLRAHLKERLPEYMIPSAFFVLPALPLTLNGKLDHGGLASLGKSRPDTDGAFCPARTREEKMLARIWAEALNLEKVGIYDNFFELGGDSIVSIQIAARARKAGLKLTPLQLFRLPTIAQLCLMTGESQGNHDNSPGETSLTDQRQGKSGEFPLADLDSEQLDRAIGAAQTAWN